MSAVFYVGPESGVYHTHSDCSALTNSWRYWPRERAASVDKLPPSDSYMSRGRRRTICARCQRRDMSGNAKKDTP